MDPKKKTVIKKFTIFLRNCMCKNTTIFVHNALERMEKSIEAVVGQELQNTPDEKTRNTGRDLNKESIVSFMFLR